MTRQNPDHPTAATPPSQHEKRSKNREIENEMICPPEQEGEPPRPKTEPKPGRPSR